MPGESSRSIDIRLRAAVESAPSGLLMVDQAGRIVLVNRMVEELFGYPREELLGQPLELLIPERFRSGHPGFRHDFMKDPRMRRMGAGRDLYGRRKDGAEIPIEIGLTPVPTDEGLFVLSSIVDITERRRAEERFRVAVESAPSGMLMVDRAGRIVLVNREIERLFGWSREELLGEPVEKLVPARYRGSHPQFRTGFFHKPQARAMGAGRELFGLRKDGSEIPIEIGLNPIETDDGVFVLSSIVDIGPRKLAEQDRLRLENQLRQAQKMEALGTLAGGVAHDFNNVLQGIVGYSELVMEHLPRGSRTESDMQEVLHMAERGQQVVQRILAFSRRQEQLRRQIDLTLPVQQAVKLLRNTLPPAVEIRVQTEEPGPQVMADATALHQVVMNLANNAAQAMPAGGTLDVVVQRTYVRDSFVRAHPDLTEGWYGLMSVTDSGAGMSDEVKERAFEPFFTTKPAGTGTGLGLSMVHGIVQEHGGVILLESTPGHGTTVRCYFPELSGEREQAMAQDSDIPQGKGERVLAVDDEPKIVGFIERWLEDLGYTVRVETRAANALEVIKAAPGEWDLVMTDYLMPGMNGLELAAQIKQIRPDLPILLSTGFIEDIPDESIRLAGVGRVIKKPVFMRPLAQALRELLEG